MHPSIHQLQQEREVLRVRAACNVSRATAIDVFTGHGELFLSFTIYDRPCTNKKRSGREAKDKSDKKSYRRDPPAGGGRWMRSTM
jgi:hypothetical protein